MPSNGWLRLSCHQDLGARRHDRRQHHSRGGITHPLGSCHLHEVRIPRTSFHRAGCETTVVSPFSPCNSASDGVSIIALRNLFTEWDQVIARFSRLAFRKRPSGWSPIQTCGFHGFHDSCAIAILRCGHSPCASSTSLSSRSVQRAWHLLATAKALNVGISQSNNVFGP